MRYRSERQCRRGQTKCPDCPHRSDLERAVNEPQQQHSIPVDLWQTDGSSLASSLFQRVHELGNGSRQKISESQYRAACLDGKRYLLIEKAEQRMNYCQRSLRVLMLASVQIYPTPEQSTLRHIPRPVFCSTRHGTKWSKHCEKPITVIHFTIRHVTLLPEILYSGDSLVLLASHKRYYQINTVELLS